VFSFGLHRTNTDEGNLGLVVNHALVLRCLENSMLTFAICSMVQNTAFILYFNVVKVNTQIFEELSGKHDKCYITECHLVHIYKSLQ